MLGLVLRGDVYNDYRKRKSKFACVDCVIDSLGQNLGTQARL